jgi:transposase
MNEISKIHVGLDVHKDSISIGVAQPGRAPGKLLCKIAHHLPTLLKRLDKLGAPAELHVVYEAGPTGFGLARSLLERGYGCEVIAPSKTPQRPGERVKTDARDCVMLAEYSRHGALHAVWIPDPEDEAIRDLSRAREDAVNARSQARLQLKGFLLRHGVRYEGKTSWCLTHYRWLAQQSFAHAAAQMAFTECCLAIQAADQRVARLNQALADVVAQWRFAEVVAALQALRGVALVTAIGLAAEIGDFSRFEHPRKLMGYLGLTPSERSSGERTSRGAITKTGNKHARRLLTEAAWHYRHPARISRAAQLRQESLSEPVRATAWKAQLRLGRRFAALNKRGLQANKACIAVARELAGFVWAIGRQAMLESAARATR